MSQYNVASSLATSTSGARSRIAPRSLARSANLNSDSAMFRRHREILPVMSVSPDCLRSGYAEISPDFRRRAEPRRIMIVAGMSKP